MKMLMGICDDELNVRIHIRNLCQKYCDQQEIEFEIVEFQSGEEVLNYNGEAMHLLFLDIELPDINGIQVMKQIEETNTVWRIVFVSGHEEVVWSTFGVKTLDFGKKPIEYVHVEKWCNIVKKEFQEDTFIRFEEGNEDTYRKISEIIYLEAVGNYSKVYTKNNSFLVRGNLKLLQGKLSKQHFIRVHKTYIVNFDFIEQIKENISIKYAELELPIGRTYKNTLKECYHSYIMQKVEERIC